MKAQLIRLLENSDTEFISGLSAGNWESYAEKIISKASIISISKSDSLQGFIAFYDNDPQNQLAFLSMLLVKKECQNRGYAKALLQLSISELIAKGFKKYGLEVHHKNEKAIQLYQRNDFTIIEKRADFLYMEKTLDS